MSKNPFEKGPAEPDNAKEKISYQRYLNLGGNINEKDYESALKNAKDTTTLDKTLITNAKNIAKFAGIELHDTKDNIDPRIILYGILRRDIQPKDVTHHHQQMSDQRIFAEALRMLGDVDSLKKVIKAYEGNPSMSFKYPAEEEYEEKKAA